MADVDKKSHVLTCKRMRGVCLSISFQLGAREMRRTNLRSAGATAGENRDLSRLRSTHHGRKDMHPSLEEKPGIRAQLRITTILTKCYSRLINSLREQSRQRLNEKGQYTPADGKKFCKATVSELQVCCLDTKGELAIVQDNENSLPLDVWFLE